MAGKDTVLTLVVSRRYILTNAHCVDNSVVVQVSRDASPPLVALERGAERLLAACNTGLQVRKRNVSKSFPAQVLCIGLECDLALLTVPSDEFWSGVHAIKLEDELVEVRSCLIHDSAVV